MTMPRRRRDQASAGAVIPASVVVLVLAVLASIVILALAGLSTEMIITISGLAVGAASELVRRLVKAVNAGRRRE
ncbi:hypothetical protein ACIRD3_30365 [Kitasatospora sp. NPDC093550]|uniref:hypothetical protein n=1 Tax=Kitasatospora sp. NPDC093550 TaxID=3364089 RepID=UPI00382B3D9E